VNPKFKKTFGTDPLICTAENLANEYKISREDQDAFAHNSQLKTDAAQNNAKLAREIIPVSIPQRKGLSIIVEKDETSRFVSITGKNLSANQYISTFSFHFFNGCQEGFNCPFIN